MKREGRLPAPFAGGFHRDDYVANFSDAERRGWLVPEAPPRPGLNVKVQIELDPPVLISEERGEDASWCLFGGTIVAIEDGGERLCVRATGSSDNVPEIFDHEWELRLARDERYDNPWQLESIAEVVEGRPLPPAIPKMSMTDKLIQFRIGVGGALALDFLDRLAVRLPGGIALALSDGTGREKPLIHTIDPALGEIRGVRTTLHLFASPRGIPSEWRPHVDALVIAGGPAETDGSIKGLDLPTERLEGADGDALGTLKAISKAVLTRLRDAG